MKDGVVTEVVGDPLHPINGGKLCVKAGVSSVEALYHPDRLNYPLMRAGRRGDGKWRQVNWEEALTEIKVNHGLSERHEAVLAALRIRLKGSAGKSLEEMLDAADDAPPDRLGEAIAKTEAKGKPSLDDLLGKEPKKPDWPS